MKSHGRDAGAARDALEAALMIAEELGMRPLAADLTRELAPSA
jgi:hypothetical protein